MGQTVQQYDAEDVPSFGSPQGHHYQETKKEETKDPVLRLKK